MLSDKSKLQKYNSIYSKSKSTQNKYNKLYHSYENEKHKIQEYNYLREEKGWNHRRAQTDCVSLQM